MSSATGFFRSRTVRTAAVPAVAAVLAMALAAPPALAAMRDFTCSGDQLGRMVITDPTTFQRAAAGPMSRTFTAHPQVRRYGAGAPVAVVTECTASYDYAHFVGGSGRIGPIDGAYRLRVECVAKPEGGSGGRGLDQQFSVPAPASGEPFDSPEMKAGLEQAACRSARSAIFAAMRSR